MNKNTKLLLLILAFALLLGSAALLYGQLSGDADREAIVTQPPTEDAAAPTADTTQGASTLAPDFTVTDAAGTQYNLSDFFGKPIVLNFWASWCSPCKMEMPDFEETYLEYGDEIHFLMVNCTTSSWETFDDALAFIQAEGFTFPVYYDTTGEASSTYGTYSIPMTFFIDAQGNLTAYAQGAIDMDVLETGIGMIYTP